MAQHIVENILIALCLAAAVSAGAAPPPKHMQVASVEKPDDEFTHARHLLERGSSYETAIVNLRVALLADPRNAKYYNLLGCALADRAASIAHAAAGIEKFHDFHTRYLKDVDRWQAVQQGKKAPLYTDAKTVEAEFGDAAEVARKAEAMHMNETQWRAFVASNVENDKRIEAIYVQRFAVGSPPPNEPILRTEDDGKPFKLTLEQAKPVFTDLVKQSELAFKESEELSTAAEDRAQLVVTRAWAEIMLSREARDLALDAPFDRAAILKAYDDAIDLQPSSPDLVCAKADALLELTKKPDQPDAAETDEAIGVYRKALSLEHKDALHLNARIFFLLEPGMFSPKLKADVETRERLRSAIAADPQNAFLVYIQATMSLDAPAVTPLDAAQAQTDAEALKLVETGNALSNYSTELYGERLPPTLSVAFKYDLDREFAPFAPLTRLSRGLCSGAAAELKAEATTEALRRLLAVVAMGKKIQAALPKYASLQESDAKSVTHGGLGISQAGYTGLAKYYDAMNDTENAKRARDEADAARQDAKDRMERFEVEETFGYTVVYYSVSY